MTSHVHLGFELGTGEPVAVPLQHLAVTGQTTSGKTTALEALVERSGCSAIAFVTKRAEATFQEAQRVAPYFRERADWQFVASVLEATMRERMRFERSWIMRASKGAKTLADVQRNVRKGMLKAKGLSADVYMTLDAYLDIVIPQIDQLAYASTLQLAAGLNVMDVSPYSTELQALVIRSVIEWVYEHGDNVLVIIPEAWEFVPQARGSPVLLACEQLIRKGAAARNYVWLDSQDLAGVHKNILRQVSTYVLGRQREANEVRRTLAHIPGRKPSIDDVMHLERGQFLACYGRTVTKVFVQPAWMDAPSARDIAMGRASLSERAPPTRTTWRIKPAEEDAVKPEEAKALQDEQLRTRVRVLEETIAELRQQKLPTFTRPPNVPPAATPRSAETKPSASFNGVDLDALYEAIKLKALADPGDAKLLAILRRVPELEVANVVERIKADTKYQFGLIASLIAEDFFERPVDVSGVADALKRRGRKVHPANVYRDLNKLAGLGFLMKEEDGYRAVAGMKVHIVETEAA